MTDGLYLGDAAGERFYLPLEALTQTFGIIGRRGSGKTSTAVVMMEEFVANGLPVSMVDPLGVGWGLRSSADGKSEGLPVTVLGGAHGDLPLEHTAGGLVAELVVDHPGAYVLDLSGFDSLAQHDRFAADFAARLYQVKNRQRDPMHLVVDEADTFAPQRPFKGQERMLGAFEAIARRGRVRGLGVTLISQRPAVLNKNVLSQIECLIALQVTAPQDRDALKAWAEGFADRNLVNEFLSSLAPLTVGEAWVWSPSWLQLFQRIKVRPRRTFDSSSTPRAGQARVEPRVLAPVDLEQLRTRMAETIERAEADDPKKLQARIRQLERDIARAKSEKPAESRAADSKELESLRDTIADKNAVIEELRRDLAYAVDYGQRQAVALEAIRKGLGDTAIEVDRALNRPMPKQPEVSHALPLPARASGANRRGDRGTGAAPARAAVSERAARDATDDSAARSMAEGLSGPGAPARVGLDGLKAGARRILEELASRYPAPWTRPQIGTLTGFAHRGGTFTTYLGELKRRGLVVEQNRELSATDLALDTLGGKPPAPTTHEEALAIWRRVLKPGCYRMLEAVIESGEVGITRGDLGEAVEMTASGGTFLTYLGILRRNGLVSESGGFIVATEVLFPDGR